MHLSPDAIVIWQYHFIKINATIAWTWGVMLLLVLGSLLVTRAYARTGVRTRWQNLLELIVTTIETQIAEVGLKTPRTYIPFLGTLFLFIATSSLLTIVPGFEPPTGSLSSTAALALCVFVAVPFYGVSSIGLGGYLKTYMEPTFIMLPFNLISEVSRTLALAVRLFGNMMSGVMIIGILLAISPYFFPVLMTILGLLTGMVQAYIFSILAAVYIAAATLVNDQKQSSANAHSEKHE